MSRKAPITGTFGLPSPSFAFLRLPSPYDTTIGEDDGDALITRA
jgi:hypothetical protein